MREPLITIVRLDGLGDGDPRFVIGSGAWHLERDGLEGFDGVPYSLSTQDYAQYDGAYLIGERVGTVDRTIAAAAIGDVAGLREEAERFFIPGREYEVHVVAEGRSRYLVGRQYAFSLTVDNRVHAQRLSWTVLSLDPMLLSEDAHDFDVAEAERRRGFPFCSPVDRRGVESGSGSAPAHVAGFVTGVLSKRIAMTNRGDATAYPRFDIRATSLVLNPSVSILDRSGSEVTRFAVNLAMREGDVLVVDFSTRPTTVELNGSNVLSKVAAGSTLATGIGVGDFFVTWSADMGDASLHIVPTIRERFVTI